MDPVWSKVLRDYEDRKLAGEAEEFAAELGLPSVRHLYNIASRIPTHLLYRRTIADLRSLSRSGKPGYKRPGPLELEPEG